MTSPSAAQLKARQQKQFKWLWDMENREITRNLLANMPDYFWNCRTCNESGVHHDANTMSMKLNQHLGHDTWIDYGGRSRRA